MRLLFDYQPQFVGKCLLYIADISSCFYCVFIFKSIFSLLVYDPFATMFPWIQFPPLLCNFWIECLFVFIVRGVHWAFLFVANFFDYITRIEFPFVLPRALEFITFPSDITQSIVLMEQFYWIPSSSLSLISFPICLSVFQSAEEVVPLFRAITTYGCLWLFDKRWENWIKKLFFVMISLNFFFQINSFSVFHKGYPPTFLLLD